MSQAKGDGAKALIFMEVQQRHMAAMSGAMPGAANEAVIEEFKAIYSDYDQLVHMGAPEHPLYSITDVQRRMADVLEWIARSYDSMRDIEQANYYYEKAVGRFQSLGDRDSVARNQQNIAQLGYEREGSVDQELERLRTKLSSLPEGSLQHAIALVELGELYMRSGDDFASEENLLVAMEELERMGHPDPSGEDAKEVLNQTVQDIMSGQATAGTTRFETLTAVHGAYQRIYQCLSTIYADRENLDEAAKYFQKFEQLSANELKGEDIARTILDRYGEV
jgi:tetratricopeptide (TPR) repeat protein